MQTKNSEPALANKTMGSGHAIMIAALGISGLGVTVLASPALAEDAPEKAEISVKYLQYKESQPGLQRVQVQSPSLHLITPIASVWSLDVGVVSDTVSGASPRYHTVISSASRMKDFRRAADLSLSRYFDRMKFSIGANVSSEHDYLSKALALNASFASDDQNTTWQLGVGKAKDHIHAQTRKVFDQRDASEFLLGVTQVVSPRDLVQVNYTHTRAHGYLSDPYKSLDIRPRERNQSALNLRYHHHFSEADASLRLHYRYYQDNFGIRAHSLQTEYAQSLGNGWTVTPRLRLYSQSAAHFYFEPRYTVLYIPVGYKVGSAQFVSEDQRLSAFGARTFGLQVRKQLSPDWEIDLSLERYRQRSEWTWAKANTLGLAPLNASIVQLGLKHHF